MSLTRRNVLGAMLVGTAVVPALPALGAHAATERLVLARAGQTEYDVVVHSSDGPVVQNAAHELAVYLSQVTGADFAVVSEPQRTRHIFVGSAAEVEADFAELHEDGFVLVTLGDDIHIAGAIDRGTLYGVYWLLDHLVGVKWFAPDTTEIPSVPSLELARDDLNGMHKPRYRYRELIAATTNDFHYRQHNLMNGPMGYLDVPSQPGINTWSDYWAEHVWDGKTHHEVVNDQSLWSGSSLLMMDSRTRDLATTNLLAKVTELATKGFRPRLAFDQADGYWRPDPDSRRFADAHGGTLSAPQLDLVNEVAANLAEHDPDAIVETQAYLWSQRPPEGLSVRDNVQITYASLYGDRGRPYLSDANAFSRDHLLGWAKIANDIVVWTYSTNFSHEVMPYPNALQVAADAVNLATIDQVKGYFANDAYYTHGGQQTFLRQWVLGRLLWDPSLDPRAVVRQFCDGYYGAAGRFIFDYLETLHQSFQSTNYILGSQGPDSAFLDPATVARCDHLLTCAAAVVRNTPLYADHVRHIRMPLDYVVLLRAAEFEGTMNPQRIDRENRLQRFTEALRAANMAKVAEPGGSPERLIQLAHIERTIPVAPAVVGDTGREWVESQEHSLTVWGSVSVPVADPLASNGAALQCGGAESSILQFQLDGLPLGNEEWDLYFSVRLETEVTDPTTRAVIIGVNGDPNQQPDGYWEIPLNDVPPGAYVEVQIPGVFRHDPSRVIYVAPPGISEITSFSVDRAFAVRR